MLPSSSAPGTPEPAEPNPEKLALQLGEVALLVDAPEAIQRPNGERYLPRDLAGHHDVAVLRALARAGLFVLLAGVPGSGKTALAEAAFPDLITVPCHADMTVAHLLGTHLPTESGGWRWSDGPLVNALKQGRPLYLDEVNAMPTDVSTVLHAAMDGRAMTRIDDRPDDPEIHAAPGFYVLGSYNPGSIGGRSLSEALGSRFGVQIRVDTDFHTARALGVPDLLATIAENLSVKAAAEQKAGGRGVWVPQMRELLVAARLLEVGFSMSFAASAIVGQCPWEEDRSLVREVCEHAIGIALPELTLGEQVW